MTPYVTSDPVNPYFEESEQNVVFEVNARNQSLNCDPRGDPEALESTWKKV